jgi:DNA repair photolyase
LEALLGAAAQAGARRAGFMLLRLPHELGALFEQWLEHETQNETRRFAEVRRFATERRAPLDALVKGGS